MSLLYMILNYCIYLCDILVKHAEIFVGLNVKCHLLPCFEDNGNVLTNFSKIIYFMKISSAILNVLQARFKDSYGQPNLCISATFHCDTAKMTLTLSIFSQARVMSITSNL